MSTLTPSVVSIPWQFGEHYYNTSTPSRLEGISVAEETALRSKTVLFIEDLGIELKCNRIVVATACVLFHRFFALQSLKSHNRFMIGASSLFLSTKVEEEKRDVKSVIHAWNHIRVRRKETVTENEAQEMQSKILLVERLLLQTVAFDLVILHPYSPLIQKLKSIKNNIAQQYRQEYRSIAISFINDSLRRPICLFYEPKAIAMAALYLTSIQLKIDVVPDRFGGTPSWYELFEEDIDEELFQKICYDLIKVYDDTSTAQSFAKTHESGKDKNGKEDGSERRISNKDLMTDSSLASMREAIKETEGSAPPPPPPPAEASDEDENPTKRVKV